MGVRGVALVVMVAVVGLSACGSDEDPVMPNVVGKKLDLAKSDIERAGFDRDVEVVGGGLFGVLDESNWVVCGQTPTAGDPVSEKPRLEVDRECDADEPLPEPTTSSPTTEAEEATLTVSNNAELATLLSSDQDDVLAIAFAEKYAGRVIEFDGNLASLQNHGGYKTRYDMLILAGDFSETTAVGPYFKFVDVAPTLDLHPTATVRPDVIREGDNLHIVAEVGEFNERAGTWELEPVHVDRR